MLLSELAKSSVLPDKALARWLVNNPKASRYDMNDWLEQNVLMQDSMYRRANLIYKEIRSMQLAGENIR